MSFIRFEEIQPLLDHVEQDGGGMKCYFKCAKSGTVVEARGNIPRTLAHGMANEAARGMLRQILNRISTEIRKATGFHIPLGAAANTANQGNVIASEAGKQAAIVDAFEKVAIYPGKPVQQKRFNFVENEWVYIA